MADHGQRSAAGGTFTGLVVVALLLIPLPKEPAIAQALKMSGALELTQNYRPTRWQPVRLELRNESDRVVEGSAVLPLSDENAPAVMKLPVSVPAHSFVRVLISGYFPRIELSSKKREADVPPLSTAEWRTPDGALLARTPIVGLPISAKPGEQGAEELGEIVLLVSNGAEASDDHDLDPLLAHLSDQTHVPLTLATATPQTVTR